MENKYRQLQDRLRSLDGLAVAYSGGADSSLLLQAANDILAERVLAVTVVSPTYPDTELAAALEFTSGRGIRHAIVEFNPFTIEGFAENPPQRCYLCKREYYPLILARAREQGLAVVADGSNRDDQGDFRPGMMVLNELGIISPLQEVGLTKAEIRQLLRAMGLPSWDKPDEACLASRIPYGERITPAKLARVEAAEQFLRQHGFRQVRVRYHGELARIEVGEDERARFDSGIMDTVHAHLYLLGFRYISLDLKGYRCGSLNELLADDIDYENGGR